ncbi:MAG: LPS export ABC transporter ATP-binding protein [Rubricoccaceae bacterium]
MPDSSPDTPLVLRADGLVKRYRRRTVVDDVSVTVEQGTCVGLLGPNGAGKTTTFNMIVGIVRPDAGDITLVNPAADGQGTQSGARRRLTRTPMYQRARLGIGYLAQEASVFTNLSVEDNIRAVLDFQSIPRDVKRQRVETLIEEFGLETVRASKGYQLSGGERRRTEIARALATEPRFILLDEPFAGVDPIAVEDIMEIVSTLRDKGIGVLITDHNVHETLAITDRAYLLYDGKIFAEGTADELAANEEARRRYLGQSFTLDRYKN